MSEEIELGAGFDKHVEDWGGGMTLYGGSENSVIYTNEQLYSLYEILQDRSSDEDDRSDTNSPVQTMADVERRLTALEDSE